MLFGVELRRRRVAAGISLAELARRVHYSKSYLSKIENGWHEARTDLARRCDAALDADGELAALAVSAEPASVPDQCVESEVWVMRLQSDGAGWIVPVSRREVLLAGASSLVGLQLTVPAPVDESTVDSFRTLFEETRWLGQQASPGIVLPIALVQTQAVRGVAAAAGPARAPLLRLAARYAEFTGWMAQEAGDDRAAAGWTRTAVELAEAAGEHDLTAHALVRQALITLYREDATQTVELAREAQAVPGTSWRVRGLAALREAQGHALAGDHTSCFRALERGRTSLAAVEASDVPALGPTTVHDMAEMVTGWCLHDLGRPAEAVDVLASQLARTSRTARRARARYAIRHSLACVAAGEVDQACAVATRALDDAEAVDSATVRTDARRLARSLSRWYSHAPVQDLHVRLSGLLRVRTL